MEVNIDFDGTCVSHDFPYIGKDIGAVPVLKALVDNGHRLILFTMRDDCIGRELKVEEGIINRTGNYLTEAINWFKDNDIPLYGIQTNPTQHNWTTSPKSYAHLIIDDTALGCPLKIDETISSRPFVDWRKVEIILKENSLIK